MRKAALLALLALLAGCAGPEAPTETVETGDDEESRESVPGSGGRAPDNTTRIWQHQVAYTLESSPPPATMEVPPNVTDLHVRVLSSPSATGCGANVGDPQDPLRASAEFVSPSGNATEIDLLAYECQTGILTLSGASTGGSPLAHEPGTWQVTFRGRGIGLQQTIVVEGQKTA